MFIPKNLIRCCLILPWLLLTTVFSVAQEISLPTRQPIQFEVNEPFTEDAERGWRGTGTLNRNRFQNGDELILKFDVTLDDVTNNLVDVTMVGQLFAQLAWDATGTPHFSALNSSPIITGSGVPVSVSQTSIALAEAETVAQRVFTSDGQQRFSLIFRAPIDLPDGIYSLAFVGSLQVNQGDLLPWQQNPFLAQVSDNIQPITLPIQITVGEVGQAVLPSNLYAPIRVTADGNSTMLQADLSMNVPTRSPNTYSIEPFVSFGGSDAFFPYTVDVSRSHLQTTITRPDGVAESLPEVPIEAVRVVNDSRLRLRTQGETYRRVNFPQPGEYQIAWQGVLTTDVAEWVVQGQESVLIGNQLTMQADFLDSTPLDIGDIIYPSLQVVEGVPADVRVTLRVFSSGDEETVSSVGGTAQADGRFFPSDVLRVEQAGEYILEYELTYTDSLGQLWAGSYRSIGVIDATDSTIALQGKRGLVEYDRQQQAWYDTAVFPQDDPYVVPIPYLPFHHSDVAWLPAAQAIESTIEFSQVSLTTPSIVEVGLNTPTGQPQYGFFAQHQLSVPNNSDQVSLIFGTLLDNSESFSGSYYASTLVTSTSVEDVRVLPAFDGRSRLLYAGQTTELLLHPITLRPNEILPGGSIMPLVGYMVPTLQTNIVGIVRSPSGREIVISQNTNRIGYFASDPIRLEEAGEWQVSVRLVFDGFTSAERVQTPIESSLAYSFWVGDQPAAQAIPVQIQENTDVPLSKYEMPDISQARIFVSGTSDITRFGRVLTANANLNTVSVVEPWQSLLVSEIDVGTHPTTVTITPDSLNALVVNRNSGTVSVIDLSQLVVTATHPVGELPYAIVPGEDNTALVTLQGSNELVELDLSNGDILRRIPVSVNPTGLARWGNFVWVTHLSGGDLLLIDLEAGEVIESLELGDEITASYTMAIDPFRRIAYLPQTIANSDHPNPTPDNTFVPIVNAVDLSTYTVLREERIWLPVSDQPVSLPTDVWLDFSGDRMLVTNSGSNAISILDRTTKQIEAHIEVGANPNGVLMRTDRTLIYVHNATDHTLSIIDPTWFTTGDTMPLSNSQPEFFANYGEELFFDARNIPINPTGTISCASCHALGLSDGFAWDGKITPSLADGWDENTFDLNEHIQTYLYGIGFQDGTSIESDALTAYLDRLINP